MAEEREVWIRRPRGTRLAGPIGACLALLLACCGGGEGAPARAGAGDTDAGRNDGDARDPWTARRLDLVRSLGREIHDPRVLAAMRRVPRHLFVPERYRGRAYEDRALPIGHEQTISQPFVVAAMTELLGLEGGEKVLEIGTGSGYQSAVLAEIAGCVDSIEIVPALASRARALLDRLGYRNVHVRVGDGYNGWPQEAPFDAIIVTAAPAEVPPPLIEQLAAGGRMVIPVGERAQELLLIRRNSEDPEDVTRESVLPVRFVRMTGRAQSNLEER